jgi:polar amino acid transport system substrate-binding protein
MRGVFAGMVAACIAALQFAVEARAQDPARLTICADPLNMPYSEQGMDPPGFDVEIGQALAREVGRKFFVYWADTGTRGGLTRALRRSIAAKECDAFMGIPQAPQVEGELKEMKLVLTRPYLAVGLALVQRAAEDPIRDFEQLGHVKTGVQLGTLAQGVIFNRRFPMELYRTPDLALDGLEKHEVSAALLFGPIAGWTIKQKHDGKLRISPVFQAKPEWQWNLAIAVREQDAELRARLDEALARLLESRRIAAIVEKYGVPPLAPRTN